MNKFIDAVKNTHEYSSISSHYSNKVAERSQVPLINHINEGLMILGLIGASFEAAKAYCIHPLFQNDEDLRTVGNDYTFRDGYSESTFLAMEYRYIANSYLAKMPKPVEGIHLSPIQNVNHMLIADKVQNRKDFEKYHLGIHPNSDRLLEYFKEWLDALGVSEEKYQELKNEIY